MTESASESWGWNALRWSAWFMLMFSALARLVVALDPFPHWEMDPTVIWTPTSALGPAGTIGLDCLALLGAALALLAEGLAPRRILWVPLALLGAGAVPVVHHMFTAGLVSPDDARIGLSWLGAAATGIAMAHLCRDAQVRRVTLALAVGVIGMLAAKGALQVYVEHPRTVQNFRLNREAVLAAQGWSEGSAMARGFERRLNQAEATGWFGLANVYASVAAASFVALLGISVLAWRSARSKSQDVPDGIAAVVSLGAGAAAFGVVLAGSKAGVAIPALGVVLLGVAWLARRPLGRPAWLRVRRPLLGGPLALAVVGAVLVAVALRGAVGEAIHEPSILFRWFYLQGAGRVFAEHPVWGVGPDGFKDAYMLAKPPVAPENVESPHSIVFDYASKLGLGGLALAALFFWMLWRCGTALTGPVRDDRGPPPARAKPSPSRGELWLVMGCAAAPTVLSAWMESSITSPESAAARVVGLVAWAGLALGVIWVTKATRGWGGVFGAAAIALAAHAQIEMTPIQPSSAAWFMLVLGAAAAGGVGADELRAGRARPGAWLAAPAVLAGFAVVMGVLVARPVWRWERDLGAGAQAVRPIAEIRSRRAMLAQTGPLGEDSIQQIAADLGALLSRPPPVNDAEFEGAMTHLITARLGDAIGIVRAAGAEVRHQPTEEALSRLHLGMAAACAESGDTEGAAEQAEAAERVALSGARAFPARAPAWAWLGTVRATLAASQRDRRRLQDAIAAWERAAELDPYGITFQFQVFSALVSLGRVEEAREWGRRVLAANERLRLDPLLQLTDTRRAEVERVVNGPP